MTPQAYFTALRKRWWLIVGLAVALAAAGFGVAKTTTPMYQSTASTYVTLSAAGSVSELAQGSTYTQNLIQSFALLAKTPTVLEPVIDELGIDTSPRSMAGWITVSVPLNSYIIEIRAVSPSPHEAADVANGVADHLATAVQALSPSTEQGTASVRLETVAQAVPAMHPFAPNTRMQTIVWGVGGAALGVVLALVWALTDTRLRTEADVADATQLPVLGQAPRDRRLSSRPAAAPKSSEAFRRLRTNLTFLDAGRKTKAIVVTSPAPGEGKSVSAAALAIALSEVHARVLLIDADLRKPTVALRMGLVAEAGLTSVLIGQASFEDVVQPWGDGALDVLTSGPVPPNPGQLVESDAMATLLIEAEDSYDYVVVDSPPLLPVMDAAVLARLTGGALIVVRAGKTTRQSLARAVGNLTAIDADPLGVLIVGGKAHETYYGRSSTHTK